MRKKKKKKKTGEDFSRGYKALNFMPKVNLAGKKKYLLVCRDAPRNLVSSNGIKKGRPSQNDQN